MPYSTEQQREQIAAWERALHGDRDAERHLCCADCGRKTRTHDWPYCSFHASKRALLTLFERDDNDNDDNDDDDISGGHRVPSLRLQFGLR